jgi:hypothetical protein
LSIFTFRHRRVNHGAKVVYEANLLLPVNSGSGDAIFYGACPASGAAKSDLGTGQGKI